MSARRKPRPVKERERVLSPELLDLEEQLRQRLAQRKRATGEGDWASIFETLAAAGYSEVDVANAVALLDPARYDGADYRAAKTYLEQHRRSRD